MSSKVGQRRSGGVSASRPRSPRRCGTSRYCQRCGGGRDAAHHFEDVTPAVIHPMGLPPRPLRTVFRMYWTGPSMNVKTTRNALTRGASHAVLSFGEAEGFRALMVRPGRLLTTSVRQRRRITAMRGAFLGKCLIQRLGFLELMAGVNSSIRCIKWEVNSCPNRQFRH